MPLPLVKKLASLAHEVEFEQDEIVFRAAEYSPRFGLLLSGSVCIELSAPFYGMTIQILTAGDAFGWSALLSGPSYTSYAVCTEPCEVFAINGQKFLDLLREDHTMGLRVMEFAAKILKNRLERRTAQFLKVMSKHPDIQKLLGL